MLQNFSLWRDVTKDTFFLNIITSIFKAFVNHSAAHTSYGSYSKVLRRSILPFNTLLTAVFHSFLKMGLLIFLCEASFRAFQHWQTVKAFFI